MYIQCGNLENAENKKKEGKLLIISPVSGNSC